MVEIINDLHHVDVLLVVHEEVLMASFDLHPLDVLLGVREVVLYGPASSASSTRGPKTPVRTHSPLWVSQWNLVGIIMVSYGYSNGLLCEF